MLSRHSRVSGNLSATTQEAKKPRLRGDDRRKKHHHMKFILALTLLLFALPAQAREECDNATDYTPIAKRTEKTLLYKIIAPCDEKNAPISYLFGTFHSDSPKLKPLYDKVLTVFDVVDAVALEVVQSPSSQRNAQRSITLPNDHAGIKTLLSNATWKNVLKKLIPLLGMNEGQLNRFKPWGLAVLAQYPPPEADGIVLDARIQRRAEASNMELISLESIDNQFDVFESISLKNQISFLELTLQDIDEMPDTHRRLMRFYLAEDTAGIMTMSDELFDEMATKNPELAYHLRTELIEKRNQHMAKKMSEQIRKNSTLFAIGALHLPGDMGVISLLEGDGYRVYPVD